MKHQFAFLPIEGIGAPIKALRKTLSILLLAVFGLTLASPLLAQGGDGESGLHACCRRSGKHRCTMMGSEPGSLAAAVSGVTDHFRAPLEKCPFCPPAVTTSHPNPLAVPLAQAGFAPEGSRTAGVRPSGYKRRISRDRSQPKRGPPAYLLS